MGWFTLGAAALGYLGAKSTNKANAQLYDKQIEWEREKANNAHQWEVEDLRKAGLNPILSAGGSGAVVGSPSVIPSENEINSGLNSALASYNTRADVELKKEQANSMKLNNDLLYKTLNDQVAFARQNFENSAKQGLLLDEQIKEVNARTKDIEANNYVVKRGIELAESVLKGVNTAGVISTGINDVTSGAKDLVTDIMNDFRMKEAKFKSKIDPWFDTRRRSNMTPSQRHLATFGRGRSRVNE